ncbi:hypothetical protein ACVJBD_002234 [Rhizobium mongolense]
MPMADRYDFANLSPIEFEGLCADLVCIAIPSNTTRAKPHHSAAKELGVRRSDHFWPRLTVGGPITWGADPDQPKAWPGSAPDSILTAAFYYPIRAGSCYSGQGHGNGAMVARLHLGKGKDRAILKLVRFSFAGFEVVGGKLGRLCLASHGILFT